MLNGGCEELKVVLVTFLLERKEGRGFENFLPFVAFHNK